MATTTFGGYIASAITVPAGQTASVTTNGGGPTVVTATAGTYSSVLAFLTQFASDLTSQRPVTGGSWSVRNAAGVSVGWGDAGASDLVTLAVSAGTFSITWTSTDLSDLLGFSTITGQTSVTASVPLRGIWQPNCPLVAASRYFSAPAITDARRTKGPTGVVTTHVGNTRYEHKDLSWSHVEMDRVWRNEDASNQSLEQFLDDTQWARGHAWFSAGSKCQLYTHENNLVGEFGSVTNWWLTGFASIRDITSRASDGWDGMWSVRIPEICSDGT